MIYLHHVLRTTSFEILHFCSYEATMFFHHEQLVETFARNGLYCDCNSQLPQHQMHFETVSFQITFAVHIVFSACGNYNIHSFFVVISPNLTKFDIRTLFFNRHFCHDVRKRLKFTNLHCLKNFGTVNEFFSLHFKSQNLYATATQFRYPRIHL